VVSERRFIWWWTYSPHLSPLPHSHVVWMSFISRSWLTLRLERSLGDISDTAMARRGAEEKVRHRKSWTGALCGSGALPNKMEGVGVDVDAFKALVSVEDISRVRCGAERRLEAKAS